METTTLTHLIEEKRTLDKIQFIKLNHFANYVKNSSDFSLDPTYVYCFKRSMGRPSCNFMGAVAFMSNKMDGEFYIPEGFFCNHLSITYNGKNFKMFIKDDAYTIFDALSEYFSLPLTHTYAIFSNGFKFELNDGLKKQEKYLNHKMSNIDYGDWKETSRFGRQNFGEYLYEYLKWLHQYMDDLSSRIRTEKSQLVITGESL